MIGVRELIEHEPYLSQKTIASRLGIHHERVKRISKHELDLVKMSFLWVPHLLTELQKSSKSIL
jgi:predicted XRE-type DNA-binding protein